MHISADAKKSKCQRNAEPFVQDHKLVIRGAAENNLKNIDVEIPLGVFTCVTGVSGSGKSSLINEILYKRLAKELNRAKTRAGRHEEMLGLEKLDKVINIDQSPIGRTPRSNPATYTGLFDHDSGCVRADNRGEGQRVSEGQIQL